MPDSSEGGIAIKVRLGFVANSSSSSFIVGFKSVPKDAEEMTTALFGDRKEFHSPYDNNHWPSDSIAASVFTSMQGQKPLRSKKAVAAEIMSGHAEGAPECWGHGCDQYMQDFVEYCCTGRDSAGNLHECGRVIKCKVGANRPTKCPNCGSPIPTRAKWEPTMDWVSYTRDCKKHADTLATNILSRYKGRIYIFEYSDNDGALGSAMEHGDLFNNIDGEFIRVSKH